MIFVLWLLLGVVGASSLHLGWFAGFGLGVVAFVLQACWSVAVNVMADDVSGWLPVLTRSVIQSGVRKLPESDRERYEQEWTAEAARFTGRPISGLVWTLAEVWWGARGLSNELDESAKAREPVALAGPRRHAKNITGPFGGSEIAHALIRLGWQPVNARDPKELAEFHHPDGYNEVHFDVQAQVFAGDPVFRGIASQMIGRHLHGVARKRAIDVQTERLLETLRRLREGNERPPRVLT